MAENQANFRNAKTAVGSMDELMSELAGQSSPTEAQKKKRSISYAEDIIVDSAASNISRNMLEDDDSKGDGAGKSSHLDAVIEEVSKNEILPEAKKRQNAGNGDSLSRLWDSYQAGVNPNYGRRGLAHPTAEVFVGAKPHFEERLPPRLVPSSRLAEYVTDDGNVLFYRPRKYAELVAERRIVQRRYPKSAVKVEQDNGFMKIYHDLREFAKHISEEDKAELRRLFRIPEQLPL